VSLILYQTDEWTCEPNAVRISHILNESKVFLLYQQYPCLVLYGRNKRHKYGYQNNIAVAHDATYNYLNIAYQLQSP
jgi:hypothetical protein